MKGILFIMVVSFKNNTKHKLKVVELANDKVMVKFNNHHYLFPNLLVCAKRMGFKKIWRIQQVKTVQVSPKLLLKSSLNSFLS